MNKPKYTLYQYFKDAGVVELPGNFKNYDMAKVPRDSQISGLNRCITQLKWGLYDDAGTGKSIILYATALYYLQCGNKVVCCMPPILFSQFVRKMDEEFIGCTSDYNIEVFTKGPKQRDKVFSENNTDMIIMTYEMFVKEHKRLAAADFPVLLTDEAHKLRNSDSDFYSSVYNYTDNEETALIVATGTPIFHTPLDGFAMTNLTSRGTYKSLKSFKRLHCNISRFRITKVIRGRRKKIWVEDIKGYKNLDTLHVNMYKKARRVTKDQALSLKEPSIIIEDVRMSPAHKRLYHQLAEERMLELPDDRLLIAREATQLREHLMQTACNPHLYTEKKMDDNLFLMLREKIEEILGVSKLVVYAHHNVTLEGLQDRLEEFSPALVYGGKRNTTSKNTKEIDRFLNNPDCKILLAHPQSAGVGLNLEDVCHYVLFYEPTPIHGQFTQAMDRVFRGEQPKAVVVYIFRLLGTVYPGMVSSMLDNSDSAGIVNCDKSTFRQWVYSDESL